MNTHLRVLHVDDDLFFLEVSKQILEMESSFEVDLATSVEEAFKKMETQGYDCIISDYEMPRKNGLEFLKDLREQKNEISFVLFTGKGREEVAIKALNLGADGYFNKQGSPETVYGELSHGVRMAVERMNAQNTVLQSKEDWECTFNSVPHLIAVIDDQHKIRRINHAMAKQLGVAPDQAIGLNCFSCVHGVGKPIDLCPHSLTLADGKEHTVEVEEPRLGGTLLVSTSPLRDARGRIVGSVHSARNISERKKAEKLIQENNLKVNRIINALTDGVCVLDRNWNFVYVNGTFANLIDSEPDKMMGKSCWQFFPKWVGTAVEINFREAMKSREFKRFEWKGLYSNDTWEVNVLPSEEGIMVNSRAITEQRKAEERTVQSEQKYEGLFEAALNGILQTTVEGTIVSANLAAARILGYPSQESAIGVNITSLWLQPEKRDLFLEELSADGKLRDYEIEFKRSDGKIIYCLCNIVAQIDSQHKIKWIQTILEDITEKKKAEEALRQSEQRYHDLADSLPEIVFETDEAGRPTLVNRQSLETMGYSFDEIKHKSFLEFLAPEDRSRAALNVQMILQGGKSKGHEYTIVKKDGTRFPVLIFAEAITSEPGSKGLRGIIVNMTEAKAAADRLASVNEKLKVVGSLTRHDIRNKLHAIRANAYLIKKRANIDVNIIKSLENIDLAVSQSDELFEFSRLYEKIGAEKLIPIKVEHSFNQAASLIPHLGVEIVDKTQGLTVLADSMLMQLFYNLIDNSLKHGKNVNQIRLSYSQNQEETRVFYEDNGVGVAEENKEKIFSEGFTTGGTGLGLKLVKKMIESYGWTIKENGIPNKGVRFQITVPTEKICYRQNMLMVSEFENDLTA